MAQSIRKKKLSDSDARERFSAVLSAGTVALSSYDDEAAPPAEVHRRSGKLTLVDRSLTVCLTEEGISRNAFRNAALLVSARVALLRVNRSLGFLFELNDSLLRRAAMRPGAVTVYSENWETLAVPVRRVCGLPRAGGFEGEEESFAEL